MATHAEGAPRRLKRIKPPADTDAVPKDETKTYEFYKRIIHTSILRLKNERGKWKKKKITGNKRESWWKKKN